MTGETIRVLVVDDDRDDAELAADLLSEVGVWSPEVSLAFSYEEGLAAIRSGSIDVCLLDYNLGARTGIDFILEPDVEASGTPVILLTGRATYDVDQQALRAGAADFLPKQGLTSAALERSIRYAVERSRRRKTEARLRALQANSREIISIVGSGGEVLYVSPSVQRILGHRPETLVGSSALEHVHPEDRPRVAAELERLTDDPAGVATLQYRVHHADGRWRVVDSWAENYLSDPEIRGIVVGSWDVTASSAQAEHIRFQARLLDTVSQAVIATDLDGKVIYWNHAAQALYGWSRAEAFGRLVAELTPTEASREQAAEILEHMRAGHTWSGEFPVRRKDGTAFMALVSNAPILDAEGEPVGFVGVSSDISRLKRVERDLRERVKELHLLVLCGQVMDRQELSLRERLRRVVEAIPAGWYDPEITEARIVWDDETLATSGFRETPWMLSAPIPVEFGEEGRVDVALVREGPDLGDGPFLPEERDLVETLGRTLGEALERDRLSRQLAQTVANLDEAVLIVDTREHGRMIRDVNPAAERIFGWSRDELIGDTTEKIHADREHFERFGEEMFAALESGGVFRANFPFRRRDGSTFEAEQTVSLLDPAEGIEGGVVGAVRDVSARHAAEAALRRTQERFRVLSREISDVFYVIDPRGRVLYTSPSIESAAGYTAAEFEGMNALDIVHPEDRLEVQRLLQRVADSEGETVRESYRVITKSGKLLHVESVARNLSSQPEIGGIVVSSRDITERAAFEERLRLAQRLESIGRLAGGIAHDFNNILTVIRSQADLVLLDLADPRLVEDVGLIRAAADRAATLTGQLLAFSREQVLRPRVIDLGELLQGMGRMLDRIIGEDIHVAYEVPENVPPVEVDPGQLEQVLMNLAINARDAMPEGGRLTFSIQEEQLDAEGAERLPGMEPGRYATLSVSDTGTGMTQEILTRIFEPFFTTKEKGKGTGLGLAMAYGVMKQSGGGIHAESTPGVGSVFQLRFPVSAKIAESLAEGATRVGSLGAAVDGGHVLVVEDDLAVRRITQRILERAGFTVTATETAEGAVELLETVDAVDVLLTDLVLPGMSGRALVEHVMEIHPDLPIVVASGYDQESPGHKGALPAEVAFIQKPFTTEGLVATIARAIATQ